MYAIREEPQNARLRITLSGRVPTDEALRAVRHASMLLRTDSLDEVVCDVTLLQRGPGKLMLLAAFMASELPGRTRLAVVAGDWQLQVAQRVLRYGGIGLRARCFVDESVALDWLALQQTPARPITPEARHLEHLAAELSRTVRRHTVEKVGPAA